MWFCSVPIGQNRTTSSFVFLKSRDGVMMNNARHAAVKTLKKKPWLIICVIGLVVACIYQFADFASRNFPCAWLVNFIGFGLAAIGLIQLIVILDSENQIDWHYLRVFFWIFAIMGSCYYGIGLYGNSQEYEWIGMFCLLQSIIYFSGWHIIKSSNLKSASRKLLIYPIVLLMAVAISSLPGYGTLYEKVSGGFLGLLLFTQTKDVWEIYVKSRSADNELDASTMSAEGPTVEDMPAQ